MALVGYARVSTQTSISAFGLPVSDTQHQALLPSLEK